MSGPGLGTSEVPSHLETKYDRQLRLWGLGGQKCLEQSHICLLNASACGTETLKNLVLPGIGKFTVVDGHAVTHDDLGTNFFVTLADLGKSRAACTADHLQELNTGVKGIALEEDPVRLIEQRPTFFSEQNVTLVIATQFPEKAIIALSSILGEDIPLICVRSCGEIGFVRVQCGSRAIIETFPDQLQEDLRITNPFPELREFAAHIGDPDGITDTMLRSHIPYPILLMHYFSQWRQHEGAAWACTPLTTQERNQVKALVNAGKHPNEENFAEAIKNIHKISDPTIPGSLIALIESTDADEESLTAETEPFWFCVAALRRFHLANQKLPINGKLQDMTATTDWFIGMQTIFQKKADQV